MKIKLAKTAGFCMGVRRAVDMVLDLQRSKPVLPIVTYGPLIHNPQTLELLKSRGIEKVESLDQISEGTVVIRAHGISPQEMEILREKGVTIVDATCPRVSRVQAVIRKHAGKGAFCVIVGDEDHPEVKGLMGFASAGGIVIPEINETLLSQIPESREICVVAQTTQEPDTFNRVVEALSKPGIKLHVYNTICDSTRRRQDEVSTLAKAVDVVLVVGGKGSGNTQRLVKVAEAQGVPAFHVETDEEVDSSVFADVGTIGVTAGASTPNWQIRRVTEKLKRIGISRSFGPLRRIRRFADVIVMTYGWAALAGGGLTAACMILQKIPPTLFPVLVTMLFVFSMHLLNRIQERAGAVRFNTPEIAQFYAGHKRLLTGLGAVSSLAAFFLSMQMGLYAGIMMAGILVMGRMYTVPLPSRFFPSLKWRSLKDLPGSKTPLVAFGWAFAAAVLPVIDTKGWFSASTIAVFLFAAGMVFWRTALSDLLDIQGDRIVGRETIPILIGIKRTRSLLVSMLVLLGALIIAFTVAGVLPACALLLVVNVGIFALFFGIYRSRHLVDRILFESIMDGNLILAGIIMLLFCAVN